MERVYMALLLTIWALTAEVALSSSVPHHAGDWTNKKEDILEELEDMIEEKQLHELNEMELFFFHFKAQDLDENNKLDGVEYYHAIYNHYAKHKNHKKETEIASEIDELLKEDDKNGDGYIDYMEYFHQSRK